MRKFGVSFRRDTTSNCRILTILKEEVIIKHVLDLDARAFPPRIADVEAMANLLRATRHAPSVGLRWASRFVARRPELKIRWNRSYDY
jgi:2-keto-3-deoxy-L-rhamnonate aldolase RhmA